MFRSDIGLVRAVMDHLDHRVLTLEDLALTKPLALVLDLTLEDLNIDDMDIEAAVRIAVPRESMEEVVVDVVLLDAMNVVLKGPDMDMNIIEDLIGKVHLEDHAAPLALLGLLDHLDIMEETSVAHRLDRTGILAGMDLDTMVDRIAVVPHHVLVIGAHHLAHSVVPKNVPKVTNVIIKDHAAAKAENRIDPTKSLQENLAAGDAVGLVHVENVAETLIAVLKGTVGMELIADAGANLTAALLDLVDAKIDLAKAATDFKMLPMSA
ncbi:hypothetical protein K1T71_011662 [Dendrolimus kikuchii]|uniref:Uncharacterized protein n=1 Tax=Dendrolimus kikuchii TaxID=765133 RepID=A0ACC1CLR2_9NEOP|nr:hypothetical protein K1T71_011662 [Dendrolimus kikuchii]